MHLERPEADWPCTFREDWPRTLRGVGARRLADQQRWSRRGAAPERCMSAPRPPERCVSESARSWHSSAPWVRREAVGSGCSARRIEADGAPVAPLRAIKPSSIERDASFDAAGDKGRWSVKLHEHPEADDPGRDAERGVGDRRPADLRPLSLWRESFGLRTIGRAPRRGAADRQAWVVPRAAPPPDRCAQWFVAIGRATAERWTTPQGCRPAGPVCKSWLPSGAASTDSAATDSTSTGQAPSADHSRKLPK